MRKLCVCLCVRSEVEQASARPPPQPRCDVSVCVLGVKWNKPAPDLHHSRGVINIPVSMTSDRGAVGHYRGHGDRRHSGPSGYTAPYHQYLSNGNHSGPYIGGRYRGRGKPHGPPYWSTNFTAERACGHRGGRGAFSRGGRHGRSFDTRSRGLNGDNISQNNKYCGNCEVRPARGTASVAAKPRGYYHSSTSSTPRFS